MEESKEHELPQAAPVTEETKKEEPITFDEAKKELYCREMGFSLVMEALMASGRPLVGHNCMYDWLYIYS